MFQLDATIQLLRGESRNLNQASDFNNESDKKYVAQLTDAFLRHFGSNVPNMLWHYTSYETFEKIVSSNQIWFTHVSTLNDCSEVTHAADLSRTALEKYLKVKALTVRERCLLEYIKETLLESNADSSWYVSCFTELEDDLSQWRAYGNNATGVAIGFDARELLRFLSNSPSDRPMLCPVSYDTVKVLKFGEDLIALTLKNFDTDFNSISDDGAAAVSFIERWGKHVDAFSIVPKNPKFAAENEWRFAQQIRTIEDSARSLTIGSRRILPMLKGTCSDCKSSLLPIVQVAVGPTSTENLSNVVEAYLDTYGYSNITVTRSSIPLRK